MARRKNHTKKRHTTKRRKGGAATPLPLSYFNGQAPDVSAASGRDLLRASGMGVRPYIGPVRYGFNSAGGHRKRNSTRKGGFYPSVMGSFTHSASKYIVPMTLYAGYKMLKKSQQQSKKRTRRHR